ncbi:hypothetical protein Tco_0728610 [Tanacetum coccineum]|uniref:Uncharacterized protein n=1 Tax=Tanacetum coccineum TaxID=301880 RepID=A0ABQ4YLK3_9ASTR
MHIVDYTQLYDFLKYNQNEVNELRVERLAKAQDPLALMANSNNPFNYPVFHPDLPSSSTFIQQPLPNNNYNPQPSFNQNYMQQPMPNPEDTTTAINMALVLMAKAFKLNYSTPTNNNQRISSNPQNRQIAQPVQNPGVQNVRNQNGVIVVPVIANQNGNGNVVAARSEVSSMEQGGGTVEQHPANVEGKRVLYDSLYNNLATEVEKVNSVNRKLRETNANLTTQLARYKNQEKCFEISQEKYDKLERVQKFEIQFLKEAAKFVRDFQSLTNEADESLAKNKALELEIERLLRAVVSQDIMSIVQNNSVVDTSNLQTELERMKERFENFIIKKENEYAKLWNDWYKKCEECKYDKISYDKAYNDMQQKIERLQARL